MTVDTNAALAGSSITMMPASVSSSPGTAASGTISTGTNSAVGADTGTSDSSPSRAKRRHVYNRPVDIPYRRAICVGDAPDRSVSATSASLLFAGPPPPPFRLRQDLRHCVYGHLKRGRKLLLHRAAGPNPTYLPVPSPRKAAIIRRLRLSRRSRMGFAPPA